MKNRDNLWCYISENIEAYLENLMDRQEAAAFEDAVQNDKQLAKLVDRYREEKEAGERLFPVTNQSIENFENWDKVNALTDKLRAIDNLISVNTEESIRISAKNLVCLILALLIFGFTVWIALQMHNNPSMAR